MEDLLLKYLDDQMSAEERTAFEKRLQNEPALKEELERMRLAISAVKQYGIYNEVEQVHKEFMAAKSQDAPTAKVVRMRRPVRRFFMAAASIIIIAIGVAGIYVYQLNGEKVYNSAYVDFSVSEQRSNTPLTDIEKAYSEKNYSAVTKMAGATAVSAKERLLAGLSYLKMERADSAIGILQRIVEDSNAGYKPDAEFYLALSFLKAKQFEKALIYLERIRNDKAHLYHQYVSSKMIRDTKILVWK